MARNKVQLTCDGIPVEKVKGRLAGTVELEDEDVQRSGLDDVGVAVVVYRVQMPTFKVNSHGELERTNVYGVSELRLLDDEMRDEMIRRCGLFMEETLFTQASVPPPVEQGVEKMAYEATMSELEKVAAAAPAGVDPDTGEISDEFDVPVVEEPSDDDGEVERIAPEPRPGAVAQPSNSTGPKVAKFDPDDDGGPSDRETVGQVRERPRKDGTLDRFLQETG